MSGGYNMIINSERFLQAVDELRLQTETGNGKFRAMVEVRSSEMNWNAAELLSGWSQSTFKNIKNETRAPFKDIPRPLVILIYLAVGIDVSENQDIDHFYQLGFDISLNIVPVPINSAPEQHDVHELRDFSFEIHEANATATDPADKDFELDLRIGFDRTRLTIRSEELKVTSNKVCAETQRDPEASEPKDYNGWFDMRLANRLPLSWVFKPKIEGDVLSNRVDALELARVETKQGAAMVAEITPRRDALKVRVICADGRKANKSLADQHRDKMCAAVARKSISGSTDEYVIYRTVFHKGSI